MKRLMIGVWAALLVPFGIAGISGGPTAPWGHVVFHLGYITAAGIAVFLLLRLRRNATQKMVRLLGLLTAGAQLLFIVGQLGELLIIALQHGAHPGTEALDDARHELAAMALTFPGLFGSALLLLALTAAVVVASRRAPIVDLNHYTRSVVPGKE